MPVIGFLNSGSPDRFAPMLAAFLQGLKEGGFVEAGMSPSNIAGRTASTIVWPHWLAILLASSTIPIVFTTGGDPVQLGLVASLSRPGGNGTGVTQMTGEVAPKRVELAQELVPQATSIGLLINPKNPLAEMVKRDSLAAALKLGIKLNVLHVSEDAELQEAFTTFRQSGAGALVI
jgi:putative ABC transport system substrate-binding protein